MRQLIKAMVATPKLIERPIVIANGTKQPWAGHRKTFFRILVYPNFPEPDQRIADDVEQLPYILVLYYSRTGQTAELASQIGRGVARWEGMEARMSTSAAAFRRTPEASLPAVPDAGAPYASKDPISQIVPAWPSAAPPASATWQRR